MSDDNFSMAMKRDKFFSRYGKRARQRGSPAEAQTSPTRRFSNELEFRTERESYRPSSRKASKRRSTKQ